MSKIFKRKIEVVLRFSDEDLKRYLDLCWDHLIGVLRPEHERVQIIDYIEAINAEMKRREYDARTTHRDTICLPAGRGSDHRFASNPQRIRKLGNEPS